MTLIEYRDYFRTQLSRHYQQAEIDDVFKRCIQHYFSWSAVKIGLEPQYELAEKEVEQLIRFKAKSRGLDSATRDRRVGRVGT